jgi:hypothetical protein
MEAAETAASVEGPDPEVERTDVAGEREVDGDCGCFETVTFANRGECPTGRAGCLLNREAVGKMVEAATTESELSGIDWVTLAVAGRTCCLRLLHSESSVSLALVLLSVLVLAIVKLLVIETGD